jgi:predicted DNA binding CopG/RHH family protein
MSRETEPTKEKWPRKRGHDPVFNARAPTSLIDAVKAKAAARNVAYSVIVREALSRYVEGERAA